MSSFAIIAEVVTDQAVLENILQGYFQAEDEPVVNHVQPPRDATSKGRDPAPGGWTLVFRSLRAGDHRKALQLNDYVIIHIDTDVSLQFRPWGSMARESSARADSRSSTRSDQFATTESG